MTVVHVIPVDDKITHTTTHDCICGPEAEPQGNGRWSIVHHSLDNREAHESL